MDCWIWFFWYNRLCPLYSTWHTLMYNNIAAVAGTKNILVKIKNFKKIFFSQNFKLNKHRQRHRQWECEREYTGIATIQSNISVLSDNHWRLDQWIRCCCCWNRNKYGITCFSIPLIIYPFSEDLRWFAQVIFSLCLFIQVI